MSKDCIHCGTPFTPKQPDDDFCCAGCEVVHALLLDEGLDRFYNLKGNRKIRPAKERPFQPVETEWIEKLITDAETDDLHATATVHISGVTCVGCVWLIEKLFLRYDGAVSASVDPASAEAELTWTKGSDAMVKLSMELPRYGYLLDPATSDRTKVRESSRLLPRLGLCAAFALNTMAFTLPRYLGMDDGFAFAQLFDLIALVSSTLTLLIGGAYFFRKAIAAIQQRMIHIDLPIALGLALAFAGSCIGWFSGETDLLYFDFVAIFTTLMLAGRYVHLIAAERVSQHLQGQSAILPEVPLLDGTTKLTSALDKSDQFEIPPDRAIPVSSRLMSDSTEFSLAWMTGEPAPQVFPQGRIVPAGAISLANEPIQLVAEESHSDSMVTRLIESSKKSDIREGSSRFLKVYLICIIVIGLLSGATWLALGHPPLTALQITISIFVISCPCAIGVAIPLVERRASATMARLGVFIQKPRFWQCLGKTKNVILDKTGTLTLEHPELLTPERLDTLSKTEKTALCAMTNNSVHPLDRTLRQQLSQGHDLSPSEAEPSSYPGLGTMLKFHGHLWSLGKVGWRSNPNFTAESSPNLSCEFCRDGKLIAIFEFEESLRPEATTAITALNHTNNLSLHILSGDQKKRIKRIANELNIPSENAIGDLTPDQKRTRTESLSPALYLGDGMNDAPAFAASALTGTPVSDRSLLDRTASFLFTCKGLAFLPRLFQVAKWSQDTTALIIAFTLSYNTLAITACCLGKMTPLLAAVLMPLSSIISIAIALRPMHHQLININRPIPSSPRAVISAGKTTLDPA